MYYVVSKWQMLPGKEETFKEVGSKMREFMRRVPGVEFVEGLACEDGHALAIVGYSDEETYRRVTADGGPFETEARKYDIESAGKWLWSERGTAVDRQTVGA